MAIYISIKVLLARKYELWLDHLLYWREFTKLDSL